MDSASQSSDQGEHSEREPLATSKVSAATQSNDGGSGSRQNPGALRPILSGCLDDPPSPFGPAFPPPPPRPVREHPPRAGPLHAEVARGPARNPVPETRPKVSAASPDMLVLPETRPEHPRRHGVSGRGVVGTKHKCWRPRTPAHAYLGTGNALGADSTERSKRVEGVPHGSIAMCGARASGTVASKWPPDARI